jgi:hypothetical protein
MAHFWRKWEISGVCEAWVAVLLQYPHYGVVSGPRPEMTYPKHSWQKLTLKNAWFRSFGPFLESTVYLYWPKVWNTILSTSLKMLFRISSKTYAHRATENTQGYSILLHLDNALDCDSRLSSEKIESAKAQRVLHLHYNPGRAPSNFFLFSYMKEKLRGTSFTARDDLIFAIWHIFSEIPEMVLKNVFTNWITRLSWVKTKSGKYYTKSLKKKRIIFLAQKF